MQHRKMIDIFTCFESRVITMVPRILWEVTIIKDAVEEMTTSLALLCHRGFHQQTVLCNMIILMIVVKQPTILARRVFCCYHHPFSLLHVRHFWGHHRQTTSAHVIEFILFHLRFYFCICPNTLNSLSNVLLVQCQCPNPCDDSGMVVQ